MVGKTFHFIANGDGWIALDDGPQENAISITFSMEDLENGKTYYIVPGTHYATLVDKWEVNGTTIPSDQNGVFTLNSITGKQYPNNTTFYYNFADSSTKTCTITVISSTWNSNGWYTQPHGAVGFSPNPTLITDNLTVNYGETVTVYAKSDEGNYDSDYGAEPWWYYIKGFYNNNHVIYEASNGDINTTNDTYTFKATGNRTIYVDFIYYKR